MHLHKLYGPVVPEHQWVPAPSFVMRRNRILKLVAALTPGELLEVGCGSGTLLYEMAARGFTCRGLESSATALETASLINTDRVAISANPDHDWQAAFDYLMAMEVLEHIEDDRAALQQWHNWLKPGGRLLMSVPAHERKWTDSDVWAGHYRRYEKSALLDLVRECGFTIESIESWGFPVSNLLLSWRSRLHRKSLAERGEQGNDRSHNNAQSGVDRSAIMKLYPLMASLPGQLAMRLAFGMQSMTANRDWGVGYLLMARKPEPDNKDT